jgi:ribosomal protein S18 acetylase RimI-like enzyme
LKNINYQKLDNPVWYSLTEYHQKFALVFENIKFYHPEFAAFGGIINNENIDTPISEYTKLSDNFLMVGDKPTIPNSLTLKSELIGLQMILHQRIKIPIKEEIVKLEEEYNAELLALVKLVYPHFFKQKTTKLGNYYGIFKDNQLVAMTGERMQMNDFTEISAVITHPNYTRKGLAAQLVVHTAHQIFNQHKIPFLHVAENNFGAIKLYENLGFETRTKMSFWNLIAK